MRKINWIILLVSFGLMLILKKPISCLLNYTDLKVDDFYAPLATLIIYQWIVFIKELFVSRKGDQDKS